MFRAQKAIARVGKAPTKVDFELHLVSVANVPSTCESVVVSCARGAKTFTSPPANVDAGNMLAKFEHVFAFTSTMYIDQVKSAFDTKEFKILLHEAKSGKKVGSGSLDLASHCSPFAAPSASPASHQYQQLTLTLESKTIKIKPQILFKFRWRIVPSQDQHQHRGSVNPSESEVASIASDTSFLTDPAVGSTQHMHIVEHENIFQNNDQQQQHHHQQQQQDHSQHSPPDSTDLALNSHSPNSNSSDGSNGSHNSSTVNDITNNGSSSSKHNDTDFKLHANSSSNNNTNTNTNNISHNLKTAHSTSHMHHMHNPPPIFSAVSPDAIHHNRSQSESSLRAVSLNKLSNGPASSNDNSSDNNNNNNNTVTTNTSSDSNTDDNTDDNSNTTNTSGANKRSNTATAATSNNDVNPSENCNNDADQTTEAHSITTLTKLFEQLKSEKAAVDNQFLQALAERDRLQQEINALRNIAPPNHTTPSPGTIHSPTDNPLVLTELQSQVLQLSRHLDIALPAAAKPNATVKSGFLEKRSAHLHMFRRRRVVLTHSGIFSFYPNNEGCNLNEASVSILFAGPNSSHGETQATQSMMGSMANGNPENRRTSNASVVSIMAPTNLNDITTSNTMTTTVHRVPQNELEFEIRQNRNRVVFRASSKQECDDWIKLIQAHATTALTLEGVGIAALENLDNGSVDKNNNGNQAGGAAAQDQNPSGSSDCSPSTTTTTFSSSASSIPCDPDDASSFRVVVEFVIPAAKIGPFKKFAVPWLRSSQAEGYFQTLAIQKKQQQLDGNEVNRSSL